MHVALSCCLLFTLLQRTAFLLSHKSPSLHFCLLVLVVEVEVVAVQVGNMNYLAGRRCSAWKTAVSMARMDEERQERDETDSSSQPSSIHPSTPPSPPPSTLPPSLPPASLSLTLSHPPSAPPKPLGLFFFFFFLRATKGSLPPLFLAKNRILRSSCHMKQHTKTYNLQQN